MTQDLLVVLQNRKAYCGSLNRNGPHRLMCLDDWPIGSDTIRRLGLVGIGVSLLQEVGNCGGPALRSPLLKLK
jgi:Fe-S oxidoreductase